MHGDYKHGASAEKVPRITTLGRLEEKNRPRNSSHTPISHHNKWQRFIWILKSSTDWSSYVLMRRCSMQCEADCTTNPALANCCMMCT